jgi:hypothetical protein
MEDEMKERCIRRGGSKGRRGEGRALEIPKAVHNRKNANKGRGRLKNERNGSRDVADNGARAPVWYRSYEAHLKWSVGEPFLACCRLLFEANPELQSFGWAQPTDPRENVPDMWTDLPDVNGRVGYDLVCDGSVEAKLQSKVADFLARWGDEFLHYLFSEGSHVCIHRNGDIVMSEA